MVLAGCECSERRKKAPVKSKQCVTRRHIVIWTSRPHLAVQLSSSLVRRDELVEQGTFGEPQTLPGKIHDSLCPRVPPLYDVFRGRRQGGEHRVLRLRRVQQGCCFGVELDVSARGMLEAARDEQAGQCRERSGDTCRG